MQSKKILLVGCGDIGVALGLQLCADGHAVWGLRRNAGQLPAGIAPMAADICQPQTLTALMDHAFDQVVFTLTPGGRSASAYQRVYVEGLVNVLAVLKGKPFVVWVSSTSVYAQQQGEWVDETSPAIAGSETARILLAAEQRLAGAGLPFSVVRCSGIYGPGRYRLIEQVRALQGGAPSPAVFSNRIHRDDVVGFIRHLLQRQQRAETVEPLYLASDSEPATLWEVKRFIAGQLGIDPDRLQPQATDRASKRIANTRMLATGYQLLYANYQAGYRQVLSTMPV